MGQTACIALFGEWRILWHFVHFEEGDNGRDGMHRHDQGWIWST